MEIRWQKAAKKPPVLTFTGVYEQTSDDVLMKVKQWDVSDECIKYYIYVGHYSHNKWYTYMQGDRKELRAGSEVIAWAELPDPYGIGLWDNAGREKD